LCQGIAGGAGGAPDSPVAVGKNSPFVPTSIDY